MISARAAVGLSAGPTVPARLTGRGRFIEGGVQAQAGDERNGLRQRLAAVEQVEDGVAAVAHQHQGTLRQPAAQLQEVESQEVV